MVRPAAIISSSTEKTDPSSSSPLRVSVHNGGKARNSEYEFQGLNVMTRISAIVDHQPATGRIATRWQQRLQAELPEAVSASVLRWLLGEAALAAEPTSEDQRRILDQSMDYRYRILRERYYGIGQERAYKNLMNRLGGIFLLRNKVQTWIALSRDRARTVTDVLQEVLQEMLQNDKHMQQQITWISTCTKDARLRNALILASLEEYCLRPIRNQPLLTYRFVNYLRRSERGGMTNVPTAEFIRLVSDEIAPDDGEGNSISLLDNQALADFQEQQETLAQQELRGSIVQQLEFYLMDKVDPMAAQWLKLYLQGQTQEAIAEALAVPIKQVYRLREKVTYHAVKVFGVKQQPELVAEWLGQN
jgi:hypothetical protein